MSIEALLSDGAISRFTCKVCGDLGYVEFKYQEMGVCGECVKALAHEYLMRHSGQPDPAFAPKGFCDEFYRGHRLKTYRKEPIPQKLRTAVLERDAYRCKECGDHRNLHVDHVFPEKRGGPATLENLQCLCGSCNSKKRDRI